jgi:lysyl-tRNA synthetase class II
MVKWIEKMPWRFQVNRVIFEFEIKYLCDRSGRVESRRDASKKLSFIDISREGIGLQVVFKAQELLDADSLSCMKYVNTGDLIRMILNTAAKFINYCIKSALGILVELKLEN